MTKQNKEVHHQNSFFFLTQEDRLLLVLVKEFIFLGYPPSVSFVWISLADQPNVAMSPRSLNSIRVGVPPSLYKLYNTSTTGHYTSTSLCCKTSRQPPQQASTTSATSSQIYIFRMRESCHEWPKHSWIASFLQREGPTFEL